MATAARPVRLLVLAALTASAALLGSQVPTAVAAPTPSPAPSAASATPTPPAARAATGPTAVDDTATVPLGTDVRLAGATNDRAGSAAVQGALTVFPTDQLASLPQGSAIDDGGRRLEVVGHGTFQVEGDGSVTFTPWTGRTGNVVVRYRIVDANGATDDGRLSVVVTAGGTRDDLLTYQDVDLAVDVLANDVPGRNADGTPGTIDRTSARFPDQQGSTVSADRRTLTTPDVGTLTLDARGVVTFDPDPDLVGPGLADVAVYTAQDTTKAAGGALEHHAYAATIFLGAYPNQVLPHDDFLKTPFNASLTLPGLLNDQDSNPRFVLRPELSRFFVDDPGPGGYLSPDKRKARFPGRGTWTINADGSVLYVPPRGFVGRDGITMFVFDDQGNRGQENLEVTVQPGPTAKPDTTTVAQNVTTAASVLVNDVPGKGGDGKAGVMDATFVRFPTDGQPTGASVSAYARTLTVPGQGVYTADRVTGAVTFDPEPAFVGQAGPVTYSAQDTVERLDGRLVHNPTSATLTVTVTPVTPVAVDDVATTVYGTPVDIAVLGNDKPGAAAAPFVGASIRLRLTPDLPTGSSLSGDAKRLVVAGQGTFAARPDGVVVLTPARGFTGLVPTIGYQVSDVNGTSARASISVRVGGAAVMRPTHATVRAGETVVVDVLSNDDPPYGTGWDRSSVCLRFFAGECTKSYDIGYVSWSVDAVDGTISFFVERELDPGVFPYSVRDTTGVTRTSELDVTILPAREARGD